MREKLKVVEAEKKEDDELIPLFERHYLEEHENHFSSLFESTDDILERQY